MTGRPSYRNCGGLPTLPEKQRSLGGRLVFRSGKAEVRGGQPLEIDFVASYDRETLIQELRRIAHAPGKATLSRREVGSHGRISSAAESFHHRNPLRHRGQRRKVGVRRVLIPIPHRVEVIPAI